MSCKLKCASCKASFCDSPNEKIVKVHNQYFHWDHLTCRMCKVQLEGKSYKSKSNNQLCIDCYMEISHPRCSACGKTLYERAHGVLNQLLHECCVKCAECQHILKGVQFFLNDGKIVDEDCYYTVKHGLKKKDKLQGTT